MADVKTGIVDRGNLHLPEEESFFNSEGTPEGNLIGAEGENYVFVINDVPLRIPPSSINISTEDLVWQWKTLRSSVSTKIPSGHGACNVRLDIVFTPDLLLQLHRLIVQFKHSPFCWVKNRLVRQSIVPHWKPYQQLAFTMTNLTVTAMKGAPGTFIMQLDLRWFNYFPYGDNFLYKREWRTRPITSDGKVKFEHTIPRYTTDSTDSSVIKFLNPEFVQFRVPESESSINSWSPVAYDKDIYGGSNLYSMMRNHSGEVFDLLPLPSLMKKTDPVSDPALSNIYVRYINNLQQKALLHSFNIDIYQDLINRSNIDLDQTDPNHPWNIITIGELGGRGLVRSLVGGAIPQEIKDRWCSTMLKTTKGMRLSYEIYRSVDLGPDIKKKFFDYYRDATKASREETNKRARSLAAYRGYNLSSITDVTTKPTPKENEFVERVAFRTGIAAAVVYAIMKKESYGEAGERAGRHGGPNALAYNAHESYWYAYEHGASKEERDWMKSIGYDHQTADRSILIEKNGERVHPLSYWTEEAKLKYQEFSLGPDGKGTSLLMREAAIAGGSWGLFQVLGKYSLNYLGGADSWEDLYNQDPWEHSALSFEAWVKQAIVKDRAIIDKANRYQMGGSDGFVKLYYGVENPKYAADMLQYIKSYEKYVGNIPDDRETAAKERKAAAELEAADTDLDLHYSQSFLQKEDIEIEENAIAESVSLLRDEADQYDEFRSLVLDSAPNFSEEEGRRLLSILIELQSDGFVPYEKISSITNVFSKTFSLHIINKNHDLSYTFDDFWDPLSIKDTGIDMVEEGVITSVSGSLTHVIASIPIIGHEFPTHQHIGSIEPSYMIELASIDRNLVGLSGTADQVQGIRSILQRQARDVRSIPDSWCLCIDTFITRLFGSYDVADYHLDPETQTTNLRKRFNISRSTVQTIEGSPGSCQLIIEAQETNPYDTEYLAPAEGSESKDIEKTRKEIIHALNEFGASDHLNNIQERLLLLNLGEQVVGFESLMDIDPGAYDYFNSSENNNIERTFLVLETVNGKVRTEDVSLYTRFAEANGIYSYQESENYLNNRYLYLNLYELVGVSEDVFGSTYTRNITDQRRGYLQDQIPEKELYQKVDRQHGGISDGSQVLVVETTGIPEAYRDPQITAALKNYSRILYYIKRTAEMLLGESELNASLGVEAFGDGQTDLYLTAEEIRANTYDLNIVPSMWGAYLYHTKQDLSSLLGTLGGLSSSYIDKIIVNRPFLNLESRNPDLKKYIDDSSYSASATAQDAGRSLLGTAGLGVEYGINATIDTLFSGGISDWDPRSIGHRYNTLDNQINLLINPVQELASWSHLSYLALYPLVSSAAIESIPEAYYDGIKDKLRGPATNYGSGHPNAAFNPSKEGNNSYKIDTFLGGFNQWLTSTSVSYYDYKRFADSTYKEIEEQELSISIGDSRSYKVDGSTPIKKYYFLLSRKEFFKDAWYEKLAEAAQLNTESLQKGSGELTDFEKAMRITLFMFPGEPQDIKPPLFSTKEAERAKLYHINGLLKGLADMVRGNYPVLSALGVDQNFYGFDDSESVVSGLECYPDLDLPPHPYYNESLYAMNPDFYFWNIYDDATGTLSQEILEAAEEAVEASVVGPYETLKKMQGEGLDPSEFIDAYGAIEVPDDGLRPKVNKLISQHEGTDEILIRTHFNESGPRKNFFSLGPTSSPIAQGMDYKAYLAEGVYSLQQLEKEIKRVQAISDRYNTYAPFSRADLNTIKLTRMVKSTVEDFQKQGLPGVASGFQESMSAQDKIDILKEQLEKLKELQDNVKPIVPMLSNWHGNMQYGTSGAEKQAYIDLLNKIENTEVFFGSRLGYVQSFGETNDEDESELSDTRLASLDAYAMTFSLDSLKKLAKDSSRDILSQKSCMRRAYPTFKLFFVEEDQIYNRVLAFDDFHAFNGVKEFTVHQSRKNPADTATIVLQNISGTLDGTKRDTITDLDYYRMDDMGNYINPTIRSSDTSAESKSDASTDTVPSGSSDQAPVTTPSWVDSRNQPFGAVLLRPGLNVQLRAGYSNDPNMLTVLISGRVTDVQWNSTGDLVEIVVQSFGTELVKYLKGRNSNITISENVTDEEVYKTTHQLLGSLMLSPELKHFGRWRLNGIFQPGESKDSTVDFTDYSSKSPASAFGYVNSMLKFMNNHPYVSIAGILAISALSHLPVGRVGGVAGKGILGVLQGAGRIATTRGGIRSSVGAIIGKPIAKGPGTIVDVASGVNMQGFERAAQGIAAGAPSVTFPRLRKELIEEGYFSGIGGKIFRRIYDAKIDALKAAAKSGKGDEVVRLVENLKSSISNAQRYRFLMDDLGLAVGKGHAIIDNSASWPRLFAGLGWRTAGATFTIGGKFAKFAAFAGLGVAALEATSSTFGIGGAMSDLYENTVEAYSREYALTKARLYLSPQDDNLYPPSPKDYMNFDYSEIGFLDRVSDFIKSGTFFTIQTVGSALGVAEAAKFGRENQIQQWWDQWNQGIPPHLLEKRVTPEECEYKLRNSTIWDVFHEMTLRHPGWVYGARPYGTRFRYTMFFGVPSQRYWAKPASDRFIWRMKVLRDFATQSISDEDYKNLYGKQALDELELFDEKSEYVDEDGIIRSVYQESYDKVSRNHSVAVRDEERGIFNYVPPGSGTHIYVPPSLQSGINGIPTGNDIPLEEKKQQMMQERVLKEYLLGLQQRFVPFRRYHLLTSESDIVHNGIISSNSMVGNAVSVVYNDPSMGAEESVVPLAVTEMKASNFIPDQDITMIPVSYPNCRGYSMSLRYGLGTLLYSMREMYRGELMVLGNPRIRPWDICILRDEYNDMIGPVEVEAVVHMFSHETGFLTEIKPNAVVMSNEISSYPVLSALQTMMMAVADNKKQQADMDLQQSVEYRALISLLSRADLPAQREAYKEIFEDGFLLEEQLPNFNSDSAEQLRAGISSGDISDINSYRNFASDIAASGIFVGTALTTTLVATGLGIGALRSKKISDLIYNIGSGADVGAAAVDVLSAGAKGAAAGVGLGLAGGTGSAYAFNSVVKSGSLQWFIAAPILFAKCLEEEVISVMPLTKNGVPLVAGMSLKDPAMMWRNIFGRLYNYAQDTVIGLQDMAWIWEISGDNWWESYVAWSAENGAYNSIREDFNRAAGGQ